MEYLALYRRYRPDVFEKLIGQDSVVKTLKNQIESGRLGHAYLFTGTRGTGKTSAAKIFAKAVNCLHPVNGSPCGKCECCKALSDPSNIDVIEIDAASNNGVNEIRDLREKAQYPPVSCKYKVYIIDEVHMLTGAAFNALLKTLEEPPKHVIFILATTEVQKIPATILSRCMRFDFKLIPTEKIAKLISSIYDEVGKDYEPSAVNAIASAGEGSIRDALSIADIALSYGEGKLRYDDVTEILGATKSEVVVKLIDAVLSGDAGKILDITDELFKLGKSIGVLVKDVVKTLRDLLIITTCSSPNDILNLPEDVFNSLKALSVKTDKDSLIRIMQIFSDAENSLRYSTQPRTVFEVAAVKAARTDSDYSNDALIARINSLERQLNNLKENGISIQNKDNSSVEEKADLKQEKEISENKQNVFFELSSFADNESELKGKILTGLRRNGHEMLWNVMQGVVVSAVGNVLVLSTNSQADLSLVEREDNIKFIKEALSDFTPFEIQVKLSDETKETERFASAAENIKKIFGDDIVIVKDE
ncbi:MAG: DNA polymerase III subunit gamma/tau [Clostridia bacterium]|nr:DNA polymerase III subunit gamma/tau [Clostridia bacterium]